MAHRFIAGDTPEEAVPRLRELASRRRRLHRRPAGRGDAVRGRGRRLPAALPELHRDSGREGAGAGGRRLGRRAAASTSRSSSPPSTRSSSRPRPKRSARPCASACGPCCAWRAKRGAFVNVDMEQYRFKDLVHARLRGRAHSSRSSRDFADVGIVVQAYLKDAAEDIARLRALARAARRAVQRAAGQGRLLGGGAHRRQPERLAGARLRGQGGDRRLLRALHGRAARRLAAPAAGLRHAQPALDRPGRRSRRAPRGLQDADIEFQMLFGMAEELREAVAHEGFRTRVYVPVGQVIPGMAYLVRRLLENTSNQSWFVREAAAGVGRRPPGAPGRASTGRASRGASPGRDRRQRQLPQRAAGRSSSQPEQRRRMRGRRLRQRRRELRRTSTRSSSADEAHQPTASWPRCATRPTRQPAARPGRAGDAARRRRGGRGGTRGLPGLARPPAVRARATSCGARRRCSGARRFDLAALMVYESGKPWHEADGDVIEAIDYLRYYAGQAERLLAGRRCWATCWARTTSTCAKAAAWPRSSRPGTSPWRSSAA